MAKNANGGKAPAKPPPQRPAKEFRLGRCKVTLWLNHHEKGDWYSMTFARSYKDGDQWKTASSFGRDDLLPVSELARQAFHWIHRQQQQANGAEQREAGDEPSPEGSEIPF